MVFTHEGIPMANKIKTRTPFLTLILFVFALCSGYTFAETKVVVIPLGAEDSGFKGEATISIPVNSLRSFSGDLLPVDSIHTVNLADGSNTYFGTNFVIPSDHKPDTLIYVEFLVYNPSPNGSCRVAIRTSYGRRYRAGLPVETNGILSSTLRITSFAESDATNRLSWAFGNNPVAGDSIVFGLYRWGGYRLDTCGNVSIVGINVRYQRE
jgi:hypothetical protein